jgi:transcriptional regulator with XRE-family HTH domain
VNKSQKEVCSRVVRILKREREERRLSMNLVAARAGVSQQMVSYVEREMRNPTLETLLRMAAAIEVDFSRVISEALGRKK